MWLSHFSKLKPLRVSRTWWCPFSILKTLRVVRKWWSSFFSIKIFKSHKKMMESFFGFKNFETMTKSLFSINDFKSREAVMESFWVLESRKKVTESFFKDHASSSFYMMHKFPGTIFSLSVPTESLWLQISFFDYISLAIHFNLHEERCRVHFSKYCKSYFPITPINRFT